MGLLKVTFYMMAFNTEKYIERAVRSVLNQTVPDVNIYIRNNGSTDRTGEILEMLRKEDSRVHVVTNKVNGIGENGERDFHKEWWYNSEQELGEYISILDSDDWLEPDFVEKLYALAKENDSEIVSAGCYFRNEEEKILMVRNNINARQITLYDLRDHFATVYNNFRTWWGKLFRKDFFFENYQFAWQSNLHVRIAHPYWKNDTTVMMGYLNKCENLSCMDVPLYNFLFRESSTYETRPINQDVFGVANSIYNHGMMNLKKFNLMNDDNIKFIQSVHWSYIWEGSQRLTEITSMTVKQKYEFLEYIFKDDIVLTYIDVKLIDIFKNVKYHLNNLEKKYVNSENIYKYYLARLNCFIDIKSEENINPLSSVIFFSVICDIRNSTNFGEVFFNTSMAPNSNAVKMYARLNKTEKKWLHTYPQDFFKYLISFDENEEILKMENQLDAFWKDGKYAEAIDIAVKILENAPFNLKSLICISLYFNKESNKELASLVRESVAVLWNEDEINDVILALENADESQK